jgi:catechol 2,3-dioxygenase-like lactoylglutathione lyase family enzyme
MLTGFQANLKAPDLDEVVEFYGEKLGLPIVERRSIFPGHEDVVIGVGGDATICVEVGEGGQADTPIGFEVDDVEAVVADLRSRGLSFERFDIPGFEQDGDIVVVPGNYPSKGTGERGAFFRDSEGNLLGLGQATR